MIDPKPHFTSQTYKDKVVIVTGGSKGIGASVALSYARAGAKLVLVARNIEDLEERKAAIEKDVSGSDILVVAGDISDIEVGKRALRSAVQKWHRVDIVVANSGTEQGGAASTSSDAMGDGRTILVTILVLVVQT